MDQRAKAWKQKAQDANLQITAEMLGAHASTKRAKVGVNSKPQKLGQRPSRCGSMLACCLQSPFCQLESSA